MLEYYVLGAIITLLVYFFDEETMRLDFGVLARFLAFMALVSGFRLALYSLIGFEAPPMPFWTLGMVWWEDAVFGIPLYYTLKWREGALSKYAWYGFAAFLSVMFALGHTYQGPLGLITIVYPVFISLKYGKQYGFGTVMAAHVLYDMITYATFKFGGAITG